MSKITKKSFKNPEEMRPFPKGKVEFLRIGNLPVMQFTLQPGWRWSESVKPIAQTDSCMLNHIIYVVSGKIAFRMDDGVTVEFGPGDLGAIPPGHEVWVVGDAPCVNLDFSGSNNYAKPG
jgi:quercetin dioxygenase-like cupin family protein